MTFLKRLGNTIIKSSFPVCAGTGAKRKGQKLVASVSGSKSDLLRRSGLFRKNGRASPFRGWVAGAKSEGSYKHSV